MANGFLIRLDGAAPCACHPGETLLAAIERSGLAALTVGCRGGGCGVCRVKVMGGRYRLGKVSRRHVSETDQAEGLALACRLYPESDLDIVSVPVPRLAVNGQ